MIDLILTLLLNFDKYDIDRNHLLDAYEVPVKCVKVVDKYGKDTVLGSLQSYTVGGGSCVTIQNIAIKAISEQTLAEALRQELENLQ